ncbi:hypothetical protein HGRIS_002724 [Hohenbuehelia grisea]|uniref:Uncharacterized protein n=1 Tax=Hohenbuehelia grisea TaxID=104357 RepID=A0ABR3JM20_9AGAR
MGIFARFSQSADATPKVKGDSGKAAASQTQAPDPVATLVTETAVDVDAPTTPSLKQVVDAPKKPEDIPLPLSPPLEHVLTPSTNTIDSSTDTKLERPPAQARRFSFKTFSYVYVDETKEKEADKKREHKHELSAAKEHQKKERAAQALTKQLATPLNASTDRKAKESAMIVRSLIIGPTVNPASPKVTKAVARPQLRKIKSELMKPKSANKVIAQLRALPVLDEAVSTKDGQTVVKSTSQGPIHAVCLSHPDAEEDHLHFAHLNDELADESFAGPSLDVKGVASASIERLTQMFNDMHVIDLIKAPDLGIGQPGDGEGVLAGAVPTAETVLTGIKQITPQLMALGFATGRAILPDHKGIYPPTDRMSVLTYWWGLELALPPPSMIYLANAQSISGTAMNFLSAVALINNGVREILPFVRYISQFLDYEFSAIKAQDRGQGVVCAATWIMPAAMVPRPWDFPDPPADPAISDGNTGDKSTTEKPVTSPNVVITAPIPPLPTVIVSAPTEDNDLATEPEALPVAAS